MSIPVKVKKVWGSGDYVYGAGDNQMKHLSLIQCATCLILAWMLFGNTSVIRATVDHVIGVLVVGR